MTKEADFTIAGLQCILLEDKVAGIIGTGFIGRKTVEKIAGLVKKVIRRVIDFIKSKTILLKQPY